MLTSIVLIAVSFHRRDDLTYYVARQCTRACAATTQKLDVFDHFEIFDLMIYTV